MSSKYPDFNYANTKLPAIVDLYRCSTEKNKASLTFQEICDFCFRIPNYQQEVSDQLRKTLRILKLKGAVDFNDDFTDIRLDKTKLCLLTTDPEMTRDELSRRSWDQNQDCFQI